MSSAEKLPRTPYSLAAAAKAADDFFMSSSPIQETMRRLHRALSDLGVAYAIAGAMAANAHGHRRTTVDVDILIRLDDLLRFKEEYVGLGWADKFEGSKGFKDAVTGVPVYVLIVGQFPGDGKPKPVSFPEPERHVIVDAEGLPYLDLPTLIELKLASAMTTVHRPRDYDDVIRLIAVNSLPVDFADRLNPYVADRFRELWQAAQIVEGY